MTSIQLDTLVLSKGKHRNREDGTNVMEAVAWLAGLQHSDEPACTSPVIAEYVLVLNDGMSDTMRQLIVPYLPRLVGTVAPELELERAEYLAWQTITVITPMALDLAGLIEHAETLRNLPMHDWDAAQEALNTAHQAATRAAEYTARVSVSAAETAARAVISAVWATENEEEEAAKHATRVAAIKAAQVAVEWAAENVEEDAKAWKLVLTMLDGVLAIDPSEQGTEL